MLSCGIDSPGLQHSHRLTNGREEVNTAIDFRIDTPSSVSPISDPALTRRLISNHRAEMTACDLLRPLGARSVLPQTNQVGSDHSLPEQTANRKLTSCQNAEESEGQRNAPLRVDERKTQATPLPWKRTNISFIHKDLQLAARLSSSAAQSFKPNVFGGLHSSSDLVKKNEKFL